MIQLIESTRSTPIDPNSSKELKNLLGSDIGFLNILKNTEWIKDVELRGQEISGYSHFAVLGVGGSSLGLKAIVSGFGVSDRVTFFETLDSYSLQKKINTLNFEKTHFVVISKSGSTVETLEILRVIEKEFLNKKLINNKLSFPKHFTCITEKRANPLFDFASSKAIPVLDIPLDLGGRYSVLSPVGMLVSEALGLKTQNFVAGANEILQNPKIVLELVAALMETRNHNEWIHCMWIYSERLSLLGSWYEQLWAESLAKKTTLDNTEAPRIATPNTLMGSQDQHSLLQQITEGYKDKYLMFLRSHEEESAIPEIGAIYKAQVQAVQKALNEVDVQSIQLYFPKVQEKEFGAFFMLWQLAVSLIAQLLNINAFDQPGVERSKVLTKELLRLK